MPAVIDSSAETCATYYSVVLASFVAMCGLRFDSGILHWEWSLHCLHNFTLESCMYGCRYEKVSCELYVDTGVW